MRDVYHFLVAILYGRRNQASISPRAINGRASKLGMLASLFLRMVPLMSFSIYASHRIILYIMLLAPENFQHIQLNEGDIKIVMNADDPGYIISNSSVKSVRTIEAPVDNLMQTRPSGMEYEFSLSSDEGALLILPRGAMRFDLRNHQRFIEVATQHGADWYRFAEERLGRIISNDSLYLITGFHKTVSWALAAFEKIPGTAEYPARFRVTQAGGDNATYTWDTSRALDWRAGPIHDYENQNQTVFIRGLKVALLIGMFGTRRISVKMDAPSTPSKNPARSIGAVLADSRLSRLIDGASTSKTARSSASSVQDEATTNLALDDLRSEIQDRGPPAVGKQVMPRLIPEASQVFRPSNIIRRYWSGKKPPASIATTIDDEQITISEENMLPPEDSSQGHFETQVSEERAILSEESAVRLQSQSESGTSGVDGVNTLLRWLGGLDCSARHQDLAVLHISSTCSWLYETEEYTKWWSGNLPFLWLQGKAGAGKSVLAYSAIEHLKVSQDPVMFFYCDYRDDRTTSSVQVMYSLLCQMLHYFRDNPLGTRATSGGLIDELLEQQANGIPMDELQLPLLINRTAQEFHRRPFIIIDALDECKDVERLMGALVSWNSWGGMRIFVTSRPLQIIKEKMLDVSPKSAISWDKFEQKVSPDILKFVKKELDIYDWPGVVDTGWKEWVTSVLMEKAEGMFLWVKYQVDILTQCSSASEIREVLDKPPTPVAFYDRIILSVDMQKTGPKFVRRVLAWLVSALRPIRLREVVEALMIDLDLRTIEPEQLREAILEVPVPNVLGPQTSEFEIGCALLHVMGSIVTHDETTDYIAFPHSTIGTYLTDPSANAQYRIDPQGAHEELAATCMCYLSLCLRSCLISINHEPPFKIMSNDDAQQSRLLHSGSPLLEYVLTKSFRHLSFLLPGNETALGDMLALESDIQQHPHEWECLRKMASHTRPWPSTKHDFIIYNLIAFGSDWLLPTFLNREQLCPRLNLRHGTNPLIYTAFFQAIDQARTLLSRGADLHSCGWLVDDSRQVLPLVVAAQAEGKSAEILELFLEWRSSIPLGLFTDLASNPSNFSLPIIRRLLQTDEFVEWLEHHQEYHLSLHSFIPVGLSLDDEEDLVTTIWRLVRVGFDPRIPDASGRTFFHSASAKGYLSLVEYLVSIGVQLPDDILFFVLGRGRWNVRTAKMVHYLLGEGGNISYQPPTDIEDTVLHTAIRHAPTQLQSPSHSNTESDLVDIVTTLVNVGCDPHSRNIENYTPLHLAIVGGHVPVVKFLSQVTTPLPEDLSPAVSLASSSAREEIRNILIDSGYRWI